MSHSIRGWKARRTERDADEGTRHACVRMGIGESNVEEWRRTASDAETLELWGVRGVGLGSYGTCDTARLGVINI